MNKKQIFNLLKVGIICCVIILGFEVLFSFDSVNNFVANLIEGTGNYYIALLIAWILLFLQVWLIPVPAYIVLLSATHTSLLSTGFLNIGSNDIIFFIVAMSAYICGFLTAYFIGYKWGSKAARWVAGSDADYQKWSDVLSQKGKWYYALTVLFPFFPDDLLCILAGSMKFDFKFYCLANVVCRAIGLFCMIEMLKFMGTWNSGGFPFTILVWSLILFALIVCYIVLYVRDRKNCKDCIESKLGTGDNINQTIDSSSKQNSLSDDMENLNLGEVDNLTEENATINDRQSGDMENSENVDSDSSCRKEEKS